jgi:hypothetical protein
MAYTLKIFNGGIFPRYVRDLTKAHAERLAVLERSQGHEVEIFVTVKDTVTQVE